MFRCVRAMSSVSSNMVFLNKGHPSPSSVREGFKIIQQCTESLAQTHDGLTEQILQYGQKAGAPIFRQGLSKFLTERYGDEVSSEEIFCNAGATQGLSFVCSMFLQTGSTVFIEDPSYFIALCILRDDLGMKIVPITQDDQGVDIVLLEKKLTELSQTVPFEPAQTRPFRAMLYLVPTFNNPTGICYSPERCRELIRIARKYDLLLFCDDVYNLLHFNDGLPPPRLLSYDTKSDPDYKGHVISNCTFTKILGPGLRLGWIECSPRVFALLNNSKQACSGGAFNHYGSYLMGEALQLGLLQKHVNDEKAKLSRQQLALSVALKANLPAGVTFIQPGGGYFVWLKMPEKVVSEDLEALSKDQYGVQILPGNRFSASGGFTNYVRLSFSHYDEDVLQDAAKKFCQAVDKYLTTLKVK